MNKLIAFFILMGDVRSLVLCYLENEKGAQLDNNKHVLD